MYIVNEILQKMNSKPPGPLPDVYYPIYHIESVISYLRRRGTPEDELVRLREKNKYVWLPPKPEKARKKKKVDEIYMPKKKILKPVIKKMYT
jgi:hypothetical protein